MANRTTKSKGTPKKDTTKKTKTKTVTKSTPEMIETYPPSTPGSPSSPEGPFPFLTCSGAVAPPMPLSLFGGPSSPTVVSSGVVSGDPEKPKGVVIPIGKSGKSEVKISDPSAFPSGGSGADARIEAAMKEHRWVTVGRDYSEEWQRIVLISINGLGGLLKLIGKMTSASTGGITVLKGEETKTDDLSMFFGGVENQGARLNAALDQIKKFKWKTSEGKELSPTFDVKMKEITDKAFLLMAFPDRDKVREGLVEVREGLITIMKDEGFEFKTEIQPYIGERFAFSKEILYVGEPRVE